MTYFERIKNITTTREMAEFFAIQKYPNFPTSPCYICKYNEGPLCGNTEFGCNDEFKIQLYQSWLESKFIEQKPNEILIDLGRK
jgi:hypothetical protein